MSKNPEQGQPKENLPEKLNRIGRNFNAIGAIALTGLAVLIPGPNVLLTTGATYNALQVPLNEAGRRAFRKKRKITS